MKKLLKRTGALLLALVMIFGTGGTPAVYAAEEETVSWPSGPEISSTCAIVMEANTGAVLYEKNADDISYPASITKIMTTLLALETCPLDDIVTFSAKAVYENEGDTSHIARDLDEQMTLEQCLYGTMLESANECAFAVAEHIGGGDSQVFVNMMNERAAQLGCTNTHFNNPNGLPDENHVTTCRDMALISRAAIQNSTFRQITGTVQYTIPPTNKHADPTPLNNHHQMLSAYKGRRYLYDSCIGGKTGFTVAAGSTLVTYAERDGMLLICVIMRSQSTHYQDTAALFDYCFANYKMFNVAQNETRYADSADTENTLFGQAEPFAVLDTEAEVILPAGADFLDTETQISYEQTDGAVAGTLVYSYGGRQVGTADVLLTGASGATFEFGRVTEAQSEDAGSAAVGESDGADAGSDRPEDTNRIQRSDIGKILKIVLIIVGIAVAALFIGVFLYNNLRRIFRKKRGGSEQKYKVIRENRKWRKRRGRR